MHVLRSCMMAVLVLAGCSGEVVGERDVSSDPETTRIDGSRFELRWSLEGKQSDLSGLRVEVDDLNVLPIVVDNTPEPASLLFHAVVAAADAAALSAASHEVRIIDEASGEEILTSRLDVLDCGTSDEERQSYHLARVPTLSLRLHARSCVVGDRMATAFYTYSN